MTKAVRYQIAKLLREHERCELCRTGGAAPIDVGAAPTIENLSAP